MPTLMHLQSLMRYAQATTILPPVPRPRLSDGVLNLIAGGIAGGVSRTVVSPLERLKIIFQVTTHLDGNVIARYAVLSSARTT